MRTHNESEPLAARAASEATQPGGAVDSDLETDGTRRIRCSKLILTLARRLRRLGRPLGAAAAWLMATAVGTACLAAGGQSQGGEEVGFAASFAFAVAMSVVVALAIGGRWRLAAEFGLAIVTTIAALAGFVCLLVWATPTTFRRSMGMSVNDLLVIRRELPRFAVEVTRQTAPIGAILGAAIGSVTGLLARLARSRPKLATLLGGGLLLSFASGAVPGLAARTLTDLVLASRLEGGKWAVSSIRPHEVGSALGSLTGALLGAVGAGLVLRREGAGRARAGETHSEADVVIAGAPAEGIGTVNGGLVWAARLRRAGRRWGGFRKSREGRR
jgi:hypothetical protein